jgi:hypothetical protein
MQVFGALRVSHHHSARFRIFHARRLEVRAHDPHDADYLHAWVISGDIYRLNEIASQMAMEAAQLRTLANRYSRNL